MRRAFFAIAVACTAAVTVAGCSGGPDLRDFNPLENVGDSNLLKPSRIFDFKTPEWAKANSADNIHLSPTEPVPPSELVSAAGECAAAAPSTASAPASAPAAKPASPPSDRLEPAGGAAPSLPVFGGGVGLGMTECAVVRRAGKPSQISISAGKGGEREVMLTYDTGERPGIYRFVNGRLKIINALPETAAAEAKAKRRSHRKPERISRSHGAGRMYVQ